MSVSCQQATWVFAQTPCCRSERGSHSGVLVEAKTELEVGFGLRGRNETSPHRLRFYDFKRRGSV
jgi:hypothetical protein